MKIGMNPENMLVESVGRSVTVGRNTSLSVMLAPYVIRA